MSSLSNLFCRAPLKIPSKTLDVLLEEESLATVDALKIDVEGSEWLVLRGATRTLNNRKAPKIVFEFMDWAEAQVPGAHPGSAQELLREQGYQIWRLADYLKGGPPCPDIIRKGSEMFFAEKR